MNIKKYSNYIMVAVFILFSIFIILNCLSIQEDIIKTEINLINNIFFGCICIPIIQYIFKIISRLKTGRKKLIKSKLYLSEDIVFVIMKVYRT